MDRVSPFCQQRRTGSSRLPCKKCQWYSMPFLRCDTVSFVTLLGIVYAIVAREPPGLCRRCCPRHTASVAPDRPAHSKNHFSPNISVDRRKNKNKKSHLHPPCCPGTVKLGMEYFKR